MNIVELIQSQLSEGMLGKVAAQSGLGEMKAKMATAAAVPSLLSALGTLVGTQAGAEKLAGMMNKFNLNEVSSLASMAPGEAQAVADEGNAAMNSLFGAGTTSAAVKLLAKALNLDSEIVRKLVTYLLPIVLGTIKSKLGTSSAQGLTALFAEQKQNISNAVPAGLKLEDVAGLGAPAGSSGFGLLLPLLLMAAVAAGAYWYFVLRPQGDGMKMPEVPKVTIPGAAEAAAATKELTGFYGALGEQLATVKDVATAEAAVPKLKDVAAKFDGIKGLWDKVPEAARGPVKAAMTEGLAKLKKLVDTAMLIPGVGDKLKPILEPLLAKLEELAK